MNFPKPLLPSQDRYERYAEIHAQVLKESYPQDRFATVFCWVCVLTGFALIGWAFAEYV